MSEGPTDATARASTVPIAFILHGGTPGAERYAQSFVDELGVARHHLSLSVRLDGIVVVSIARAALKEMPHLRERLLAKWVPLGEPVRRDDEGARPVVDAIDGPPP